MTTDELHHTLNQLLSLAAENEVVEFKEAKTSFDLDTLGEYFSALSNEANLLGKSCGWLVFGVNNQHRVVGSQFKSNRIELDKLKRHIADKTTNRITFINIHEVAHADGRVVMFQIPAAPKGIPVAFDGHYYGRDNESLVPLNLEEIERIRQTTRSDWSAVLVPDARLDDLDPAAIQKARIEFRKKNPRLAPDVDDWNDITFLNKAKLTVNGVLTRTALILLGRSESEHYLSPSVAHVTWVLKKDDGSSLDYEHFHPPFLLEVDRILAKIRNLRYRYLPSGTLFPEELDMYDTYVIREALHNCLAHQDYTLGRRINLVEFPDRLLYTNAGSFIPITVEQVIERDGPPDYYRNPFLVDAMVSLGMIDTIGSGILKMFNRQRDRFFPLPEYDLSEEQTVRVTIEGKILNSNYTQLLRDRHPSLQTVILLDRVQKGKGSSLTDEQARFLRQQGLIEGRKPNYHISMLVADKTGQEAEYIRNRGFDDDHYKKMILEYLKKFKSANRLDIERLLSGKLSDLLSEKRQKQKISNLLTTLRLEGKISNEGTDRVSKWVLYEDKSQQ